MVKSVRGGRVVREGGEGEGEVREGAGEMAAESLDNGGEGKTLVFACDKVFS